MSGWILPLCSIDEVRAELADTVEKLNRDRGILSEHTDHGRFQEWRATLEKWRDRLSEQLAEMEQAEVSA